MRSMLNTVNQFETFTFKLHLKSGELEFDALQSFSKGFMVVRNGLRKKLMISFIEFIFITLVMPKMS